MPGLVVILAIGAVTAVGTAVSQKWTDVKEAISPTP